MARKSNKDAFQKEIDRIKKSIKRVEKRGFVVPDNFIPEMPKRVTAKQLNKVKNINTKDIYSKAQKLDYETGELKKAKESIKADRSESAKRGWETRRKNQENKHPYETGNMPSFSTIVISNFLAEVSHFPEVAYPIFKRWLNELIANYGENDVAEMLEGAKNEGYFITNKIAYDREKILSMISGMMEHLPDASDWFKNDLTEALEYDEPWDNPS
jgi:hypothetical protein